MKKSIAVLIYLLTYCAYGVEFDAQFEHSVAAQLRHSLNKKNLTIEGAKFQFFPRELPSEATTIEFCGLVNLRVRGKYYGYEPFRIVIETAGGRSKDYTVLSAGAEDKVLGQLANTKQLKKGKKTRKIGLKERIKIQGLLGFIQYPDRYKGKYHTVDPYRDYLVELLATYDWCKMRGDDLKAVVEKFNRPRRKGQQ